MRASCLHSLKNKLKNKIFIYLFLWVFRAQNSLVKLGVEGEVPGHEVADLHQGGLKNIDFFVNKCFYGKIDVFSPCTPESCG